VPISPKKSTVQVRPRRYGTDLHVAMLNLRAQFQRQAT